MMNRTALVFATILSVTASSSFAAVFTTVDISALTNQTITALDSGYPVTSEGLGGVPFALNGTTWVANDAAKGGSAAQTLMVPVNIYGAAEVYTLINTLWGIDGQSGTVSDLSLTFAGSAGAVYTRKLYGNSDIRDYNPNVSTTNTINGTSATNVLTLADGRRLDMQSIALPSAFANQTLVSMTISDTGNANVQRGVFSGVTVESAAPEPGSLGIVVIGGLAVFRRRLIG